jgi:hypothetical protein
MLGIYLDKISVLVCFWKVLGLFIMDVSTVTNITE